MASFIDTTIGEFPSWAITGASIVIVTIEGLNHFIYSQLSLRQKYRKLMYFNFLKVLNYFKLGLIYGLIVDAFKLGS